MRMISEQEKRAKRQRRKLKALQRGKRKPSRSEMDLALCAALGKASPQLLRDFERLGLLDGED